MSVAREWVASAVRGNPWTYRAPDDEVEIGPLMSPLRLDVLVRRDFFRFYAEQRELYRSDFRSFAEAARQQDYFVWFERIMCPAWQPHVLETDELFATAWAERLHATARLHDAFTRSGFDTRYPITVYAGRTVLPTKTGKRVTRAVYAGDGNHRMALLLATGQTTLLPGQYRIKRFRRLEPSDTTPLLLAALGIDVQRYLAFVRAGYPSVRIEQIDGRIEVTSSPDAATEAEVSNVIRADARHLREAD